MKLKFRVVIIILFTIVISIFIFGYIDYNKKITRNLDAIIIENDILVHKELNLKEDNIIVDVETEVEISNNKIPSLKGLYQNEALAAIEKTNLSSQIIYEYSPYYDKDIVFWQSLNAEKEIVGDETLVISVSLGPENGEEPKDMVFVPLLVGMSENEATSKLLASGFTVEYEYEVNEEYEEGTVYRQNYLVDANVVKGTSIKLYVAKGAD